MFSLSPKVRFCGMISPRHPFLGSFTPPLPSFVYSQEIDPDFIVRFGFDMGEQEEFLRPFIDRLYLSGAYTRHDLPIYGPDVSRPEISWREFAPRQGYEPDQGLAVFVRETAP
ncbi:MAG: hypothetical protein GX442_22565 [Candidatus Riflebacteria bacterium]|nr:hypothetical protein [Candidatus Riflebacteria bacterium]